MNWLESFIVRQRATAKSHLTKAQLWTFGAAQDLSEKALYKQ
jgi:hypothetical protein